MNRETSVLATIDRWVEAGWLSRLNRAFARFLRELEPHAGDAVLWAGALASHQLDRGEVYLDLESLSRRPGLTLAIPSDEDWASRFEPAQAELSVLEAFGLAQWRSELRNSSLVSTGEGKTPLVLDGSRLYLRRYWQYQRTLDRCIQERLETVRSGLPEALRNRIDALFPGSPEQPDWQKIACVLALRSRFAIITGGPGTGKTTTLTKLLALLIQLMQIEAPGARKPIIHLAAPTGKASARVSESIAKALEQLNVDDNIKESIPKKAGTLHRLLGSRPDSRRFKHNRHLRLAADIVIVDEASMIDLEMMASLLDALPDNAQLILLGDKDQLASVEAGSVMGDLCRGAENAAYDNDARAWIEKYSGERLPPSTAPGTNINQQTVMLRHSHRFGEHSGIGRLARAVNAGDSIQAQAILNDTATFKDLLPQPETDYQRLRARPEPDAADALLKKLVAVNTGTNADSKPNPRQGYGYYLDAIRNRPANDAASYDAWAERVLSAFDAFQVLCALRRGRWGVEEMNRRIEDWLFPKQAPGLWYEGRPVMITRNDYNLGLMNGDIGIALYDPTGKLRVAFPTDDPLAAAKIRWLSPLRLPDAETAFAITVHKSQGSEFNHVVLALPEAQSPVLTRELIYTGITRAKENFTLLESREGVFDQAVKARMKNPVDSG
ncbi:exodeoxyribonuclease V subunit alpha [Candidatus Methylomicrobium oryzae]|uniref:exodeoxyribonuclease V subunit alpha n=1 Tax=Candidatus Methylomicrobium oryzae TaxID=2802053 RepID=UPI00192049A7|nr:exodeoxyribonuclease V subunit alpha [Methylomicrobium sp. RS1]MBL1263296.1 exodeoxyribonuclease V subunit alpha [Methylomicrobium sp. RS1]